MDDVARPQIPLPVGSIGRIGVGWWGAICLIVTEASLFGYLLFAYLYSAVIVDGNFLPSPAPGMSLALPATLVLLASSAAVWWGERGARTGAKAETRLGFLVAFLCGLGFVVLQVLEWRSQRFTPRSDAYGSMFFAITGAHLAHLLAGMLALAVVLLWSGLGYFDAKRNAPVLIAAAYWHFVVVIGVAVFVVLYVTPFLLSDR
jgi:heme/copper-type cytochrome/quinol oxidase subunit 3